MRYRDGRRSICVSSQSGCPLTCTFCATGAMKLRPQPDRLGDRRPGASLSKDRADRPLRVHGHGRTADEPRQRARRVRAPPRHRHHPPAHHGIDRRMDPGDRTPRRAADAAASGALAACRRGCAALRAHAGQRALPARRGDRGVPRLLRAQAPTGVRRVRDARRASTIATSRRSRSPARCRRGTGMGVRSSRST